MRKIDKSIILSTEYKKWEEELEKQGSNHHKYDGNASKFRFYQDVVMNLFHCQEGLCAYTEQFLCSDEFYQKDKWDEKGKYIRQSEKVNYGQLEHFDESKKEKQGWLWDNLFMIHSDTNLNKGTKSIDSILKPDRKGYSPERLLEYDADTGVFFPNSKLTKRRQERVREMLITLGINHKTLARMRKVSVERFIAYSTTLPATEFPTAFRMAQL
jgi:hypothetical protein